MCMIYISDSFWNGNTHYNTHVQRRSTTWPGGGGGGEVRHRHYNSLVRVGVYLHKNITDKIYIVYRPMRVAVAGPDGRSTLDYHYAVCRVGGGANAIGPLAMGQRSSYIVNLFFFPLKFPFLQLNVCKF